MRHFLIMTLTALVFVHAGCTVPVVHFPDADAFARHLFAVAREGSASEWGAQLTAARRAQGSAYVAGHFESWRRLLLELEQGAFGGNLSVAQFREKDGALEFHSEEKWHHLIRVTMEDGGWKINQD